MSEPTHDDKVKKLDGLVRDLGTCMLTSVDPNGRLYSRPMQVQGGLEDGQLFFFTYDESDKVLEIEHERQVNCAFACPKSSAYVSISGKAAVTHDRTLIEDKWNPALRAWFPDGVDTPGISLIRVTVSDAQYWDTPGSTVVHLYGVVKAMVTGRSPEGGDNQKVNLR